jgi:hypothetical protein
MRFSLVPDLEILSQALFFFSKSGIVYSMNGMQNKILFFVVAAALIGSLLFAYHRFYKTQNNFLLLAHNLHVQPPYSFVFYKIGGTQKANFL